MARLRTEQIRERVFEDRAYLCYYTPDGGSENDVEYSIENTRSTLAFPDDLKITKKQFEIVLKELLMTDKFQDHKFWEGYVTFKYIG